MSASNITPADVEAVIASEHYFTGEEGVKGADYELLGGDTVVFPSNVPPALDGLLVCVLVLKNGHLVTGEALLQDLRKPDPERARASARRRAFDKAYDMVVYAERERLAAPPQVLSPSLNLTPEKLAELREAMRNAPPMPIISTEPSGIPWTVILEGSPTSLPAQGDWLDTVDTDDGREVHVLHHVRDGKWLHDGEFTFQHGYYFRPIAWAPRPPAFDGEVPE